MHHLIVEFWFHRRIIGALAIANCWWLSTFWLVFLNTQFLFCYCTFSIPRRFYSSYISAQWHLLWLSTVVVAVSLLFMFRTLAAAVLFVFILLSRLVLCCTLGSVVFEPSVLLPGLRLCLALCAVLTAPCFGFFHATFCSFVWSRLLAFIIK